MKVKFRDIQGGKTFECNGDKFVKLLRIAKIDDGLPCNAVNIRTGQIIMFVDNTTVEIEIGDEEAIEMAKNLKEYCKHHHCGECPFYDDELCDVYDVPRYWDVEED